MYICIVSREVRLETCARYEVTSLKLSTCDRITQDGGYNQMRTDSNSLNLKCKH